MTNLFVKEKLADAMAIEFQHDLEADTLSPDDIEKKVTRSRKKIINAPAIIILSVDANDEAAAKQAGADFVYKGAPPDELIATLTPILQKDK